MELFLANGLICSDSATNAHWDSITRIHEIQNNTGLHDWT